MVKVTQIFNSNTLEEVSDYLVANGFFRKEKNLTGTMFIKDDKSVLIYADKISFREYDPRHDDIEFAEFASFEGINILNTVDWIYLLHITGIVPLKQFLKNIKRENIKPLDFSQLVNGMFKNVKTIMIVLCFVMLAFTSCKTQKAISQRSGFFTRTDKGYVFVPTTDWEEYKPGGAPCDTVKQYMLTTSKKSKP